MFCSAVNQRHPTTANENQRQPTTSRQPPSLSFSRAGLSLPGRPAWPIHRSADVEGGGGWRMRTGTDSCRDRSMITSRILPRALTCPQWRTQHTGIQGMSCTFGFGVPIQSADWRGMTAFDANVDQHAANTSPRNLAVQLCMQTTP